MIRNRDINVNANRNALPSFKIPFDSQLNSLITQTNSNFIFPFKNETKDLPLNQFSDSVLTPGSAPSPCPFTIILNETDNPLYDKTETFYIKNNDITESVPKKNTQKKKNECVKPKFLSLTPAQIKLDNEITESIKKGENFKNIEKMLKGLLIEKY